MLVLVIVVSLIQYEINFFSLCFSFAFSSAFLIPPISTPLTLSQASGAPSLFRFPRSKTAASRPLQKWLKVIGLGDGLPILARDVK